MDLPAAEITPRSIRVMAATFVAAMLNSQMLSSFAVAILMQPIIAETGWSRGEVGAGVTFSQWGMALGAAIAGRYVDRLGPRAIMLPLTFISGLAMMSVSLTAGSILLFYSANLIAGACTPGAAGFAKMLSLWFDRRRGLAISLLGIGAFVSIILLPTVTQWMSETIGWRQTYIAFGGAILLIAFPIMALFFREPSDNPRSDARAADAPTAQMGAVLKRSMFWLLLGSQLGATFASTGLSTHAIGVLTREGLTAAEAAFGLTLIGAGGLIAQLLAGYLLDRFDTPRVVLPFAALSLVGVALLMVGHDHAVLFAGALLFGLGCGGETSTTSYFITRYYGVRKFATVYGIIKPVLMCCAAPAPYLVGALYDRTEDYWSGLLMCAAMLAASALCFVWLPRYPTSSGSLCLTPSDIHSS